MFDIFWILAFVNNNNNNLTGTRCTYFERRCTTPTWPNKNDVTFLVCNMLIDDTLYQIKNAVNTVALGRRDLTPIS